MTADECLMLAIQYLKCQQFLTNAWWIQIGIKEPSLSWILPANQENYCAHYILWCNWRKAIIPPSLVLALTTFKLQHAPGCTLGLVLIINNIPCACVITNTCFCILHSNCPLHNSNWCCHSSTPHYVVMSSLPPVWPCCCVQCLGWWVLSHWGQLHPVCRCWHSAQTNTSSKVSTGSFILWLLRSRPGVSQQSGNEAKYMHWRRKTIPA